jgi:HAMP domain-containing protein
MTTFRPFLPRGASTFALGAASAGLALAAVLAVAGTASAQDRPAAAAVHSLDLKMPDGSIEHVRYWGNRIPVVTFGEGDAAYQDTLRQNAAAIAAPTEDPFFGAQSPFAELDRMSAAMDRQAAQMFQQIGAMQGEAFGPGDRMTTADMGRLPAGGEGYTMVETISNGQDCTQSIRYFSDGHGKPQVQQASSGACKAVPGAQQQMIRAEPMQPAQAPHDDGLLKVGYHAPQPLVQPSARSGFARDF